MVQRWLFFEVDLATVDLSLLNLRTEISPFLNRNPKSAVPRSSDGIIRGGGQRYSTKPSQDEAKTGTRYLVAMLEGSAARLNLFMMLSTGKIR